MRQPRISIRVVITCARSVPAKLAAVSTEAYRHRPASWSVLTASAFSPAEQLSGTPSSTSPTLAACADTTCTHTHTQHLAPHQDAKDPAVHT